MIVNKIWIKYENRKALNSLKKTYKTLWRIHCQGYFLFGIIPIYIRQTLVEKV